ncbi:MAG TPA: ABC transporter permease [Candidatus Acidoferrales bacterium]|nr:ABC transporter permease [Candidatus Acidoferrales bacterium]
MTLYRLLLRLYPASYRAEYGAEMCEVFAEERRRCVGIWTKCALWAATIGDVIFNAAAVHAEIARRDVRFAMRSLRRSPGFTITGVLLIAIGIGANAAIFTLADFVLVRPLPFPQPERLVKVWERLPGYTMMELSPANYRDFKAAANSFSSLAAYNENSANLVGQGEPERVHGATVTANFFPTLQRSPWIGRSFRAEDDATGAPGTIVFSYALWQAVFGGDSDVLGKVVYLDGEAFTVIGIMPPDFRFPTRETQFWKTYRLGGDDYQDRNNNYLEGIGRLNGGVSLTQAQAEMTLIAKQLERQYPKDNENTGATVISMRDDEISGQSRMLLMALCGASLCVLVIACANLANLLLARSLARNKEFSIRVSLGAHPRQMLRQLLTESLLLGIAGGTGAIALAVATLPLLARLVPNDLPMQGVPPVDWRLVALSLGLTAIAVISFGLVPALRVCSTAKLNGLREGVRTGGGPHQRARSALVIAEVSVSVVLLVSSGLLIRALWKVQATDPGFRTKNMLTLATVLPFPKYEKTSDRAQFYDKVLMEVRGLPGVTDAGYISGIPFEWGGGIWPVQFNGSDDRRVEGNVASMRYITPGFFSTMGIVIRSGRGISDADTNDRQYVAVVSESFVRRYWPTEQSIGRHFNMAFHDREVVGVVGDIRVRGLERPSEPQVYLSYKQVGDGDFPFYAPKELVIHSSGPPEQLIPMVREIVREADPEQPISKVSTMEDIFAGETESRTVQIRVLVTFTAVAILLAGLGIYGISAFAVSMRQQEFGIRIALGAQSSDILGMVLRQAAALAATGLLAGTVLAWGAGRMLENLLAGVRPTDALTFAIAAGVCVLTALTGAMMPAMRAVKIDPVSVMRTE